VVTRKKEKGRGSWGKGGKDTAETGKVGGGYSCVNTNRGKKYERAARQLREGAREKQFYSKRGSEGEGKGTSVN